MMPRPHQWRQDRVESSRLLRTTRCVVLHLALALVLSGVRATSAASVTLPIEWETISAQRSNADDSGPKSRYSQASCVIGADFIISHGYLYNHRCVRL